MHRSRNQRNPSKEATELTRQPIKHSNCTPNPAISHASTYRSAEAKAMSSSSPAPPPRGSAPRGRKAAAAPAGLKRGPWTPEEDEVLARCVALEGEGRWRTLPRRAGLLRCGKSCRLRWMNYLRPSIKRGPIAADEEDLILRLHRLLGNRWSLIAGRIPGRTDNEIKNYWNTHLSKKLIGQGIDPRTHKPLASAHAAAAAASIAKTAPEPPQLPPATCPAGSPVAHATPFLEDMISFEYCGDGWDGFDQFGRSEASDGGVGCSTVVNDDGAFSLFLDSLINDDADVCLQQQHDLSLKEDGGGSGGGDDQLKNSGDDHSNDLQVEDSVGACTVVARNLWE